MLHNLRVASPCTADWNQMAGDDRVRNCGQCQKSVFNLSGMTHDEAEALLIERNGELCVRYYQRADGTILLADCAVPTTHHHRWVAAGAAALLAGSIGAAAALSRLPPPERLQAVPEHPMMGALTPPPSSLPPPPPPPPPEARWSIEQGTPTMGEVRALPWPEPQPAQPPAHPANHRPATAGKRAR